MRRLYLPLPLAFLEDVGRSLHALLRFAVFCAGRNGGDGLILSTVLRVFKELSASLNELRTLGPFVLIDVNSQEDVRLRLEFV